MTQEPFRAEQPATQAPLHGRKTALGARGWIPEAVWTRVLLLLGCLMSLKAVLLWSFRKHLFEQHWRINEPSMSWLNWVAFGGLVALGTVSLVQLGRQCQIVGVRAVRAVNALVVLLGLVFVFLCFHNGDKNLIYPIMDGTLKWESLGPYLNLNLFFQSPFLAAWIGGYGLLYWFMARTGRERWMLHVTAVCAGAYALLCLRELSDNGYLLWVADSLGVGAVLAGRRGTERFSLGWVLAPVGWSLFFWALFVPFSPNLQSLNPYYVMLLAQSVVLFGAGTWLAASRGALKCWGPYLPFFLGTFLLLANRNYPMASNYNNLLRLSLESPRYFGGELMLAAGLALVGIIYGRVARRQHWWWLDVLILTVLALTLVDLRLSQLMGIRLGWDVLEVADSPRMMWRMARPYLPQTLAALTGLGLAYWVGLLALKRLFSAGSGGAALSRVMRSKGLCLAGVSFVLLAALGIFTVTSDKAEGQAVLHLSLLDSLGHSATSTRMGREEFFKEAQALGIGRFDLAGGTHPSNPPRNLNVVLVFMESSYNQYLSLFGGSEETQPRLARYKSRMELYPNFFSNFAGSINARFAAFTSLYPARDFHAFTTQRVPVQSVFEILHQHGYACSLFYSSFLDYTGFRDFLMQRGLDEIRDADTMPGARRSEPVSWGLREEETMAAICGQIQKHAAAKERFFLTYVPAAPHYPFDCIPKEFSKFKPLEMGNYTPFYLNELLYMDWVLSSIVEQLEKSGELDSTLVIITNDHGEMLGANGGLIGHGWCLTPELANTPLLIMDPGRPGYRLNYTVGSQIDLLPTILERLNLPLPAGQLYEGHSLDSGGPGETHKTYLNTMQQFGVLAGARLYLGDRDASARQGGLAPGGVFQIRNEGNKTVFQKDLSAPEASISIQAFDAFQENLLRNYTYYSRSVVNPGK